MRTANTTTAATESKYGIILSHIATNLEMGMNQLITDNLAKDIANEIQLLNGWEDLKSELKYVETALKNGYAQNFYTGKVNLTAEARAKFQNAQKNIKKIMDAKTEYALLTNGL